MNFAENLLRYRDDQVALIFKGEGQESERLPMHELYDQVARLAKSLRAMGVIPGDRVVGFMPNMMETIIAMLAATSLGAVWSSCSPDFGIKGVLDRFGQIEPKVLFTANGYTYGGKNFDSLGRIADIVKQLPSIEKVVVVPYTDPEPGYQSRFPRAVLLPGFSAPRRQVWKSTSSRFRPIIRCISCILPGPPGCPSAWSRALAGSWCITSRN